MSVDPRDADISYHRVIAGDVRGESRPEWYRTALMDARGVVFIPAALGGDETAISLCAMRHDGVVVTYDLHAFVPAMWMAGKFPDIADICSLIQDRVRTVVGWRIRDASADWSGDPDPIGDIREFLGE